MNAAPDARAPGHSRAATARAERAYHHLKLRLLEGDLGPGERLSVVALARDLACSRVPVMEALKRLEGEGFVAIVPQVGCEVVEPDANEVRDFFTLFAGAEGTVARFAAERRTPEEAAAFERLHVEVRRDAAAAGGPGDADPAYRRLNARFHGAVHAMARSPVVSGIAAGLWDRSDYYIKLAFGSLYFSARVRAAHASIREAIVAGDPHAAAAAVHEHLEGVGARVSERMRATG